MIGCHRRRDDRVDFAYVEASIIERRGDRFGPKLSRTHSGSGNVALAYAAAFGDPVIGRIHDGCEIVVRDDR